MDKNTIIGLVAIMAILIGFGIYNKPSEKEIQRQEHIRDSISIVEQQKNSQEAMRLASTSQSNGSIGNVNQNDSAKIANEKKEFGVFASAIEGKVAYSTLENSKVKITFSNLGGRPYCVQLKEYRSYDSLPLRLFDGDSTTFGFSMSASIKTPIRCFSIK